MAKLGFKFSWEVDEVMTPKPVIKDVTVPVPGSSQFHVAELVLKIKDHEDYIVSKLFAKSPAITKTNVLAQYSFLVRCLALIQTPTVSGIKDLSGDLTEVEY